MPQKQFDKIRGLLYCTNMFVSVVLDPGSIDSARAVSAVLTNAGFTKVQRACWECASVSKSVLTQLKKDIDKTTDYYDAVRIYQFPLDGMFVVTELAHKHWKRYRFQLAPSSVYRSQQ